MTDTVIPSVRSRIMRAVSQKDTGPEMRVRSILHRLGYRFRLHKKDLPGTPDIVLPKYKTAIYVHGCFWHQHSGCRKSKRPTSKIEYWNRKLDENIERDRQRLKELEQTGWRVLVVWECEIGNSEALKLKFQNCLSGNHIIST